ncbi:MULTISPECIES: DUF4012 domain-containing protein [unclassified Nocardioides]|uniref:DUF4012 domain-containing protein n=1 Tax=unclassified Nocardioides TaxID=2615069 RepID=UPI000A27016F|nr:MULTISPECIES: DUF4012 domain-containing protein [unclassified Nocardioides]
MRVLGPRPVTTVIILLLGVLVLVGGWLGWQAWQVNRDLGAAADDAAALQTALEDGDQASIDRSLADLQEHSAAASDRTDGVSWGLLTHAPVVGDDARGVRVVSDVMADLSNDGLEPLARTASRLDALLPRNGRVSIAAVRSLQEPVAQARDALADADRRLAAEDSGGFVQRLRDRYRELAGKVSDAAEAMNSAETALDVLPSMLGDGESRHYLLVFQNNAEIRATGGLPGAVSLVRARDGKIELTRQVAANSFGQRQSPVLPLSEVERLLYGAQLGTYFLDANFTPDFPRTADLMRARWEEVYGDDLDGVLSLDPVAISYLLAATGPVQVGDVTLSSDNAVDELLHQVYLRYPDPDRQDRFFRDVARTVFGAVSSGGGAAPRDLLSALARGADEGRIYVHSFDEDEQSALAGTRVAGELGTEATSTPLVNVTLNDTTGAKMSYYLRYSVHVMSTYCEDGVQGLSAHARLTSDAPADAASLPGYITGAGKFGVEPGNQIVTVRIFGPVGGTIDGFSINAKEFPPGDLVQDGRPVTSAYVYLTPGETVDVTWSMKTGPGQTDGARVTVTPSIAAKSSSSTPASVCS